MRDLNEHEVEQVGGAFSFATAGEDIKSFFNKTFNSINSFFQKLFGGANPTR